MVFYSITSINVAYHVTGIFDKNAYGQNNTVDFTIAKYKD